MSDLYDDYYNEECCPMCYGAGVLEDECECQAIEDTCCCAEPIPPICPECGGKG